MIYDINSDLEPGLYKILDGQNHYILVLPDFNPSGDYVCLYFDTTARDLYQTIQVLCFEAWRGAQCEKIDNKRMKVSQVS